MSDRGEYRAIRRVLLNGKDFRRLPERARFAFLCIKLNVGPSGIEDWEPEALVVTLAAQMGASADQVRIALDMLEHEGWIRREDNLVWIVGQLEHDPHIKVTDPKHRKSIQRHLSGLPNLPLRAAFVGAHEAWFADDDSPVKAVPTPIEGPSKALQWPFEAPITEDREPKTENRRVSARSRSTPKALSEKHPGISASAYDYFQRAWTEQAGAVPVARFRKMAKVLLTSGVRLGQAVRAIAPYAKHKRERHQALKFEWFCEDVRTWIREADSIAVEVMDPADLGLTREEADRRIAAHHAALEAADAELLRRLTLEVVA